MARTCLPSTTHVSGVDHLACSLAPRGQAEVSHAPLRREMRAGGGVTCHRNNRRVPQRSRTLSSDSGAFSFHGWTNTFTLEVAALPCLDKPSWRLGAGLPLAGMAGAAGAEAGQPPC